jgi:hypothetical protein
MPSSPGYIPGPLIVPNAWHMRLLWTLPNGRKASNVLGVNVPTGVTPTVADATNVMNEIVASAAWTALHPFLHADTSLDGIGLRNLQAASGVERLSTPPAAAGTGVANALPEEVALVVSLLTDGAGRRNRGRVYLTGFDTSGLDTDGTATAGLATAAENFITAVGAALVTGIGVDYQLGLINRAHDSYVSPFTGLTVAAEPAGIRLVIEALVRDRVFDSQRRRK